MTALACDACGDRFARAEHLALHRGRAHAQVDAAFEEALAAEEAWLANYRRHVRGSLTVLPVFLALVLVILLAYYGGIPVFLSLLLLPGSIAMGATMYYLAYSRDGET